LSISTAGQTCPTERFSSCASDSVLLAIVHVYELYLPIYLLLLLLLLLHPFNGLFSWTTWVSQYLKGKTSLDLNEARDDGVWGCSGISWTICKQSAPHSRQITTPTPHHSIFTGRMLFLTPNQQCQSTEGISTEGILTVSALTHYEVNVRRARLVPGCVTIFGRVYHLGM